MTTTPVIVAIDPGLTGAVAILDPANPGAAEVHDMPRIKDGVEPIELQRIVLTGRATIGVLEKVTPMPAQAADAGGTRPKMGATSAFNFGAAFATARTVMALSDLRLHTPSPGAWKKALGLPGGKDGKEAARQRAIELFPHLQPSLKRKGDHNRAEALLLAHYGATVILRLSA